ncbi:MAG TPA: glycogen debranching protein [Cytophagales bacterium]|nr:glycogen debranching protein [Cytophagales bacterium]
MEIFLKPTLFLLLSLLILASCQKSKPEDFLWQTDAYTLYKDSLVQQNFVAKALSPTEIISNYHSPANEFQSPEITFKFSINGKDNEMLSGKDHHFKCLTENGTCETPLIKFGEQFVDSRETPSNTYLKPSTKLKIRLDFRHIIDDFNKQGYYTTFNGDKIFKEDFKGIFIAGNTSPLIWDFDNLVSHQELELKDSDKDGIYEAELVLNAPKNEKSTNPQWKLSKDISAFPQYKSDYLLVNALYNMGLEEMQNAVEPDSTFRTGAEWAGVWTRDISYSIILSMAMLQPKVSKYSLLRKVKNGRIIQDTGTGGAYPVSTDRIIWATAAWEIYKVTGDNDWLKEAYGIIKNSIEDDLQNAYDEETGLVKGESSFLDWREQTYPKWMQPADIFESECLGTNGVHYQANMILSQMARLMEDSPTAEKHLMVAEKIKKGINQHLWIPEKGYYGQFLYGRNYKSLSPKAEALGEALCVLFDIADPERQKTIVEKVPVTDYGIPCIYPYIPNIPPYHNNGIWPFVQSYWSLASAKAKNEKSLMESLAAIYRPAALFLTNKENFVATNGDFAGTQINSSNMLWSLSGNLSMIYKIFFGIQLQLNGSLLFEPFIPTAFQGKHSLTNFKYRNAILNIEISGHGNEIKSISLDGETLEKAEIPANLEGNHSIVIVLKSNDLEEGEINKVPNIFSPVTPSVSFSNGLLSWEKVNGAREYKVLRNGKEISTVKENQLQIDEEEYSELQVIVVDSLGNESFASEPISLVKTQKIVEIENSNQKAPFPYKDFSGKGFVEISKTNNTNLSIPVTIEEDGIYALDFRYSNGNGPINTENKCAIRSIKMEDKQLGTVVFPQRGVEEWSDWGFSNAVQVQFQKGSYSISIALDPANENMNVEINQAMLDYLRVIKIK